MGEAAPARGWYTRRGRSPTGPRNPERDSRREVKRAEGYDVTDSIHRTAAGARKTPIRLPAREAARLDSATSLTAEISLSAVRDNLALLRSLLAPGVRLCAVVKADCYGHGVGPLLETITADADALAVATAAEALELRRLGAVGPVLMLFSAAAAGGRADLLAELVARKITLTVTTEEDVRAVAAGARRAGHRAAVHVKVDTGMTRSGVLPEAAGALFEALETTEDVRLAGVYTHFAGADESDKSFAREQLSHMEAVTRFAPGNQRELCVHAANSAACIDLPETHLDMVRVGIAMYGYQSSDAMHRKLPLRPALRLVARMMQVKSVPAGSRCGYGMTYTCMRDSRVGLVPVGYADGYPRCLSNRGTVRVRGRDVPILGRVAMDQVIVDVTDVPGATVGDEVEIISSDPEAPHSVESLARLAGTIPYEITCRLGERVRRLAVE